MADYDDGGLVPTGAWLVSHTRPCGCHVPVDVAADAMCRHDIERDDGLRDQQVDSHPNGHHTYMLPSGACACGLALGSPEYHSYLDSQRHVPTHRRYLNDVIVHGAPRT